MFRKNFLRFVNRSAVFVFLQIMLFTNEHYLNSDKKEINHEK